MEAERPISTIPAHQITQIYREGYGSFFGHAIKFTRNRSDAEDLVQKAFLIALSKPIDNIYSFRGFIFSTIYYLSLSHRRKVIKNAVIEENFKSLTRDSLPPDTTLEVYEILEDTFGNQLISVFNLWICGLTQAEIADQLNMCERTVGRKMARIRVQIKKALKTNIYFLRSS